MKLIIPIVIGLAVIVLGYALGIIVTHSDNWGKGDEDEETDYDTNA